MKKILAALIAALIVFTGTALAYDANNPWTGTVRWAIPVDTSFTVTFPGGETIVQFSPSSGTQNLVEPDGQSAAGNDPILRINATGNAALNFTNALTTSKHACVTNVKVSNTSTYANAMEFDTTMVVINASVPAGQGTDAYYWTNISGCSPGNIDRTLQINSSQAS